MLVSMILGADDAAPAWVSIVSLVVSILALLASTAVGLYTWRRAGELVSVSGDLRLLPFQTAKRRPARTALIYRFAYACGRAPTKAVVDELELPRSTAGRWISLARERGYLGTTEKRKAGVD